ncbi:asparagine synthase, glutamine-hydrolyzing [Halobacteroides halobius DSM 5150]|uniref:asparagine synthase (glutamine-hydrolyzing) n=1 Tax=Halobacteroides halobius (strain ATCC 35273 / DSM 5150 / MD-1) TaxID=748449 RepID=L0K711_HALHC|nr:asparagine synthase (glutamine-hydrolyzing) [Halobacteroides halobius]AGB40781.1 asparagine synthase, glutamine-hydrolyzing [Halobacteroides halobius DSM 5150]
MCGIAGWIDWERDLTRQRNVLEQMQETMKLRGPNESGEWIREDVGLVHRRLIVIDPEGGQQPMIKKKNGNTYVMVYNGELYNSSELRKKLKQHGYSFQGHSDTEVLLTSYIKWGEECVKHLNGIYAFGIWDVGRKKLYMARDRIGVKPLFYSRFGSSLVFASELKSLLAHPKIEAKIGREGLAEILAIGPGRTPGHGVFKGIEELKPGYYLVYDQHGLCKEKYWELESKPHQDSTEETIKKVRELFVDTVQRQLVSDVPICTLLSGGLDSSAITAVASNALQEAEKGQLHSYSVDYEGNDEHFEANEFQPDPDSKWIGLMSDYASTKHHDIVLPNSQLVEALKEGVYARDLPGMADIDVSLYLFCKKIEQDFTVAVSGECADEIFGGYPWYHRAEALQANTFPWSRRIDDRLQIFDSELLKEVKPSKYLDQRYQEALDEVPRLPGEDAKNAKMREMFYLNLTRWMPVLLDRKDRMSMYTSLEVRVPFCDHRLVEYVWNIPWEMKNYGGMRKGILRAALKGLLPEDIRTRPKNPYPKTFDPAYFEATRSWLLDILNNPNAPLHDLIDQDTVRQFTKVDQDFDIPWFGQLMRLPQLFAYLIQINIWLEEYNIQILF